MLFIASAILSFLFISNKYLKFVFIFSILVIAYFKDNVLYINDQEVYYLYLILSGAFFIFLVMEQKYYLIITTFVLSISYASILLWERLSPIWFILSFHLIIPIFMVILIHYLVEDLYSRLLVLVTSLVGGELIDWTVATGYYLQKSLGDFMFLRNILIAYILLLSFSGLKQIFSTFNLSSN